jgi:transcriptional regulator with XRE-family HTH domain
VTENDRAIWKRFGALIRRLRVEKGLGLREMSKLAIAEVGERGLSPAYLSAIERGLTAPPRLAVLGALAAILDIPTNKLKLAAEGWIVLDIEETLRPFPEYASLLEQVKQGGGTIETIGRAMVDVVKRFRARGKTCQLQITVRRGGKVQFLLSYRPDL